MMQNEKRGVSAEKKQNDETLDDVRHLSGKEIRNAMLLKKAKNAQKCR